MEQFGDIKLYNCDCMELMAKTPDKYYDLCIVDPPYGINVANMTMGIGKSKKSSNKKNRKWVSKDWDINTPKAEYFTELFRVSKNQIIWGGNYFELPPCKNYVIWDKEIPIGLSFADCEMAWTSYLNAPRIFRHSVYIEKGNKIHPTQKPVALYKWLLKNYAKEGYSILDTHLGSGSSAIAAHDGNFQFTGIELDKDYYEAAKLRIQTHQRQQKLF